MSDRHLTQLASLRTDGQNPLMFSHTVAPRSMCLYASHSCAFSLMAVSKFGLLHPEKRMNYNISPHSSLIVRRVSYIHTYVHTHIHTYIHTYIHTHTHTHIYIYTYSYISNKTRKGVLHNTANKITSNVIWSSKTLFLKWNKETQFVNPAYQI